jgi:hypothetical protein
MQDDKTNNALEAKQDPDSKTSILSTQLFFIVGAMITALIIAAFVLNSILQWHASFDPHSPGILIFGYLIIAVVVGAISIPISYSAFNIFYFLIKKLFLPMFSKKHPPTSQQTQPNTSK